MKLLWAERARRDLRELITFISGQSPKGASLVGSRIFATTEQLQSMPLSGRPGRVARTREIAVPRTPYLLVYRVSRVSLRILRVYHGSRQWPTSFE